MKRKAFLLLLCVLLLLPACTQALAPAANAAGRTVVARGEAFGAAVTALAAKHQAAPLTDPAEDETPSRFRNRRLIVYATRRPDLQDVLSCVADGEGRYVLQYGTEEACKNACERFFADACVRKALPEGSVYALGSFLQERTGAELLQSDRYAAALAAQGKTAEITVAVVDTGLDLTHPMFAGRLVPGYDFYNDVPGVTDGHGHGTHVCGILADNTPANVKIMPLKALGDDGSGPSLCIAAAIDYAVSHGADIINLSIGGDYDDDEDPIAVSVRGAVARGVTVVAAAGNENRDVKEVLPAGIAECVTVASYSPQFCAVSSFSNYGAGVDLSAPGEEILSAKPGGGYQTMSGTSMAAPFASAAAALLLMNDNSLSPVQLEQALKNACADILLQGADVYSGAGLLNLGVLLGDRNRPTYFNVSETDLSMKYFSRAASRYLTFRTATQDESLPASDGSLTTASTNRNVAYFDGKYIVPAGPGEADVTIAANGHARTVHVSVAETPVWIDAAAKSYAGGSGAKNDPYLISTPEQLARMALHLRTGTGEQKEYYRLTADIDLAGRDWFTAANVAVGRTPLGFGVSCAPARIDFDGANHKIKNMRVFDEVLHAAWGDSQPKNNEWYNFNTGLFGSLIDSDIYDLGLENAYSSSADSGLLCASVHQHSLITRCYTTGFSGGAGLVGSVYHAGWDGDAFDNWKIEISDCYSAASVLRAGVVDSVQSNLEDPVLIRNVFFCGEILKSSSETTAAGFAAKALGFEGRRNITITNCFSAAKSDGAGFIGRVETAVISGCCYLDGNAVGAAEAADAAVELTPRPLSFFKTKASFTGGAWASGAPWDLTSVWALKAGVNGGFPYLKNNVPSAQTGVDTGAWTDVAAASFAGGSGTQGDPYLISNARQLALFAKTLRYGGGQGVWYALTADIDLAGRLWCPPGMGSGMDTLSTNEFHRDPFMGNLLGNGHTISNMTVSSAGDTVGFLCWGADCTVRDLQFVNADVTGRNDVGVVFGKMDLYSTAANCTISGGVRGRENVGGVAGSATGGTQISGCGVSAVVRGEGWRVGGIVGTCHGVIRRCAFTGAFGGGAERFGAFSGNSSGNKVENCYATAGETVSPWERYADVSYSYVANGDTCVLYGAFDGQNHARTLPPEELRDAAKAEGFDFTSVWQPGDHGLLTLRPAEAPAPLNVHPVPARSWADDADPYLRGSGTKDDPYRITTAGQLAGVVQRLNRGDAGYRDAYYLLTNDIDLSGRVWFTSYSGLQEMCGAHFDGANHTVRGLTMQNGTGLLGNVLLTGTVENLCLEDVSGTACCALAYGNEGTVRCCHVTGVLGGILYRSDSYSRGVITQDVGALVAQNGGLISGCAVDMDLTGGDANVGAPAAYNRGTYRNCSAAGSFAGNSVHGIRLHTESSTAYCCVSTAYTPGNGSAVVYGADGAEREIADLSELSDPALYAGWDFAAVWMMDASQNGGVPVLRRSSPSGAPEPAAPGDVDGDGYVTAADARLALRRAVELEGFLPENPAFISADVVFDGEITAADARLILRAAVDLETLPER